MSENNGNNKKVGDPSLVSSEEELNEYIEIGKTEGIYKVEDFFRNPQISQMQISPDGKYIAYLAPYQRRMNIKYNLLGDSKENRITNELDRNIHAFIWANNDTILYQKDTNGDENFSLFKTTIGSTSEPVEITPFANITVQFVDDLIADENHVLIAMNKDNQQLFDVYKLNVRTNHLEKIFENSPELPATSWLTDHDGNLRLAIAMKDGINSTILFRKKNETEFQEVITTNFKTSIQPHLFDFENENYAIVTSNLNRDKSVVIKLDLTTGEEVGNILFERDDVDIDKITYSKKRKKVLGYNYYTDKLKRKIIDPKFLKLNEELDEYFDNLEYGIVSHDLEEELYILRTYSDRSLGGYYLYDRTTHQITILHKLGEWIDEEEMCSMHSIQFNAKDGTKIHGYLTLPKESSQNIPLVVNPHGGPWVRDHWGFNPEVQLLAHHGYAVLQVNYRGSTGYGKSFWEKSFKQWGQDMQTDLSDAVHYVIDNYTIDPDRIGIYGGSYGGYATLAGLCYSNNLYRCGVDFVGVSNLFTFLETIPPYWKPFLEMMYEMVGHPDRDKEMLEKYSPALNSYLIKAPLYVVQGAHDPRVNINESDQIVKSLKLNNVPVVYMVKYNEGHGFRNEENKIEFYNSLIGFLKINLKN